MEPKEPKSHTLKGEVLSLLRTAEFMVRDPDMSHCTFDTRYTVSLIVRTLSRSRKQVSKLKHKPPRRAPTADQIYNAIYALRRDGFDIRFEPHPDGNTRADLQKYLVLMNGRDFPQREIRDKRSLVEIQRANWKNNWIS